MLDSSLTKEININAKCQPSIRPLATPKIQQVTSQLSSTSCTKHHQINVQIIMMQNGLYSAGPHSQLLSPQHLMSECYIFLSPLFYLKMEISFTPLHMRFVFFKKKKAPNNSSIYYFSFFFF
jgi:hypothetical protein